MGPFVWPFYGDEALKRVEGWRATFGVGFGGWDDEGFSEVEDRLDLGHCGIVVDG